MMGGGYGSRAGGEGRGRALTAYRPGVAGKLDPRRPSKKCPYAALATTSGVLIGLVAQGVVGLDCQGVILGQTPDMNEAVKPCCR